MYRYLLAMTLSLITLFASQSLEHATNESVLKSPSAVEVITKKELESLKCNRLSECIEFATGISSVNGEGDIFFTSTIRGNTLVNYNTNTLLLIDGIPMLNPYHSSFNLDIIPLSSIKQIEIIKGASSVLYGTNAINGVINVITQNEKDKGMIRTRFGSYSTFLASTSLQYELNKDLKINLFVQQAKSQEQTFTITDVYANSREFAQKYTQNSLIAKVQYKNLWLHAQLSQRKLPNYQTRGFEKTIDTTNYDAKENNDEKEYLIAFGFKQDINDAIFLTFQTAYHKWELTKDRLEGRSKWDYFSDSIYSELEAHFFTNTANSNILGVSYELANARRYKFDLNSYDIGINNKKTHNLSLYDNGNYKFLEKVNFLYGVRYFYSHYYDATNVQDIDNSNLSTRTGLIYNPVKNIALKALYSQAYRVPSYFEKESATQVIGNPNLKPETNKTYDLILVHDLESFNYSLGLFYTQIDNKNLRIDANATTQINANLGSVIYYGTEFNTKYRFSPSFSGFANYAFTKAGNTNDERASKFVYTHALNISLSKSFLDEYMINTNIKYLSDWGDAKNYALWNTSFEYNPKTMKSLSYEMIFKNILNEKIDLPEIALNLSSNPTIPKNYANSIYLGLKYAF